jgi:hypothetical protein
MRAALSSLVEHMRRPMVQGQTVGAYRLGIAFVKAERAMGRVQDQLDRPYSRCQSVSLVASRPVS